MTALAGCPCSARRFHGRRGAGLPEAKDRRLWAPRRRSSGWVVRRVVSGSSSDLGALEGAGRRYGASNPLTPVVVAHFVNGQKDPVRLTAAMAFYQLTPEPVRTLLALKASNGILFRVWQA